MQSRSENSTRDETRDVSSDDIDAVCDRFEQAWLQGEEPDVGSYVDGYGSRRCELIAELVALDVEYRLKKGDLPSPADYINEFPEAREQL